MSSAAPAIQFHDDRLAIQFNRFDLTAYHLFLRAKRLPEYQVTFGPEDESYTIDAPARFAALLGVERPPPPAGSLEIDVLDGARSHREESTEKHVCPLQLEVIRRLARLYSNPIEIQPDVTILDPFMGIGSTGYVALGGKSPATKLATGAARNVVGFELKESYHAAAVQNCDRAARTAASRAAAPVLF